MAWGEKAVSSFEFPVSSYYFLIHHRDTETRRKVKIENRISQIVNYSITQFFSVQKTLRNGAVAVYATVAQKRPVAADIFQGMQIYFTHQDLFFIVGCLNQNFAKGVAVKYSAPKLKAPAQNTFAPDSSG